MCWRGLAKKLGVFVVSPGMQKTPLFVLTCHKIIVKIVNPVLQYEGLAGS
jgi:hypothetical protein